MMKEEEQNFREMIESEYRIRFRLMIEDEMKFRSLPGAVSNLTPREASLSQPSTCAAELKEKAQETLQVRRRKPHPHVFGKWEKIEPSRKSLAK